MAAFFRRQSTGGSDSLNGRTALNPDVQSKETSLNPNVGNNEDRYAQHIQESVTMLNPDTDGNAFIAPGMVVCGQYIIQRELDVNTGEADLFVCVNASRQEFVAKIYRRQMAIKPEVTKTLASINSPYIAKIYAMGEYEGYPVEILPYYRRGSLQGKAFGISELKKYIIPSLNEGLKILHQNGIIHKDLKPSNIMLNDDGKTVSIIDFGISSVTQNGNTVVVTHTGLTPEYSAPETFRGLFLAESDYYSLGISLFELYSGHSPYDGMSQEQIAQFSALQKVPLPDDMDEGLKTLITGVTYNDITNRKDKSNPNRRWTYEEVDKWCRGVAQPLPGISAGGISLSGEFRPFNFQGKAYDTMNSLVTALGTDWENGQKQLFRGILGGHFNSINADIANLCYDAQDESEEGKKSKDLIFFTLLCKMAPDVQKIFWKGHVYNGLDDFAHRLLTGLRAGDTGMDAVVSDMLGQGVLSAYIEAVQPTAKKQIAAMKAFESAHRVFGGSGNEKLAAGYRLGYMLSSEKELVIDGVSYKTPDDIANKMAEILGHSPEALDKFSKKLIHENDELDIQFECWLEAIGKKTALDEWRAELMG